MSEDTLYILVGVVLFVVIAITLNQIFGSASCNEEVTTTAKAFRDAIDKVGDPSYPTWYKHGPPKTGNDQYYELVPITMCESASTPLGASISAVLPTYQITFEGGPFSESKWYTSWDETYPFSGGAGNALVSYWIISAVGGQLSRIKKFAFNTDEWFKTTKTGKLFKAIMWVSNFAGETGKNTARKLSKPFLWMDLSKYYSQSLYKLGWGLPTGVFSKQRNSYKIFNDAVLTAFDDGATELPEAMLKANILKQIKYPDGTIKYIPFDKETNWYIRAVRRGLTDETALKRFDSLVETPGIFEFTPLKKSQFVISTDFSTMKNSFRKTDFYRELLRQVSDIKSYIRASKVGAWSNKYIYNLEDLSSKSKEFRKKCNSNMKLCVEAFSNLLKDPDRKDLVSKRFLEVTGREVTPADINSRDIQVFLNNYDNALIFKDFDFVIKKIDNTDLDQIDLRYNAVKNIMTEDPTVFNDGYGLGKIISESGDSDTFFNKLQLTDNIDERELIEKSLNKEILDMTAGEKADFYATLIDTRNILKTKYSVLDSMGHNWGNIYDKYGVAFDPSVLYSDVDRLNLEAYGDSFAYTPNLIIGEPTPALLEKTLTKETVNYYADKVSSFTQNQFYVRIGRSTNPLMVLSNPSFFSTYSTKLAEKERSEISDGGCQYDAICTNLGAETRTYELAETSAAKINDVKIWRPSPEDKMYSEVTNFDQAFLDELRIPIFIQTLWFRMAGPEPDPKFYVVSPCFGTGKIWKEGNTIYVDVEKCDVGDSANYCYADYEFVWGEKNTPYETPYLISAVGWALGCKAIDYEAPGASVVCNVVAKAVHQIALFSQVITATAYENIPTSVSENTAAQPISYNVENWGYWNYYKASDLCDQIDIIFSLAGGGGIPDKLAENKFAWSKAYLKALPKTSTMKALSWYDRIGSNDICTYIQVFGDAELAWPMKSKLSLNQISWGNILDTVKDLNEKLKDDYLSWSNLKDNVLPRWSELKSAVTDAEKDWLYPIRIVGRLFKATIWKAIYPYYREMLLFKVSLMKELFMGITNKDNDLTVDIMQKYSGECLYGE